MTTPGKHIVLTTPNDSHFGLIVTVDDVLADESVRGHAHCFGGTLYVHRNVGEFLEAEECSKCFS